MPWPSGEALAVPAGGSNWFCARAELIETPPLLCSWALKRIRRHWCVVCCCGPAENLLRTRKMCKQVLARCLIFDSKLVNARLTGACGPRARPTTAHQLRGIAAARLAAHLGAVGSAAAAGARRDPRGRGGAARDRRGLARPASRRPSASSLRLQCQWDRPCAPVSAIVLLLQQGGRALAAAEAASRHLPVAKLKPLRAWALPHSDSHLRVTQHTRTP